MKRVLLLLLLLNSVFALTIDYNLSKIIPTVVEPNSQATAFICLTNENPSSKIEDLNIEISTQSCISLDKNKLDVDELYLSYCFPLKLYIGECEEGVYWLKFNLKYYQGGDYKTEEKYYLFYVSKKPLVYIKDITVYNNYIGEKAKVKMTLETKDKIKDVLIKFNTSRCYPEVSEMYLGNINNGTTVEFYVKVPNIPLESCIIPLIISYRDKFDNVYLDKKYVSFPIYAIGGRIILENITHTIISGKDEKIKIKLRNEGNKEFRNIIIKFYTLKGIYLYPQEFYLQHLYKNSEKSFEINVFTDKDIAGTFAIPIYLFYTDEYGKIYNDTFYLILKVYRKPDLSLDFGNYDGKEVEIFIYNFGEIKANGVYVKINCYNCTLEKSTEFIGELEPNDYDSFSVKVYPNSRVFKIEASLFYKDSLGNIYNKTFYRNYVISIKSSNNFSLIILVGIIIALLIFVKYKRKCSS